jgi:hypothetical protein
MVKMAEATSREKALWEALHAAFIRAGTKAKVRLTRETPYALIFEHDGQILTIDQINHARVRCRAQAVRRGLDGDRPTSWDILIDEGSPTPYRLNNQVLAEADVARIVMQLLRE